MNNEPYSKNPSFPPFIYGDTFDSDRMATVHSQFRKQVMKTPGAIACICQNEEINYRQLDERASIIAQQLHEQGIGSGDLVGIMVDKSLDMVAGLLGVLQSGAAYVPIAPDCPKTRAEIILAECRSTLVLSQSWLSDHLPQGINTLLLDKVNWARALPSVSVSDEYPGTGDDTMYVTFTSGSTGVPKGVVVRHRGIVTLMQWAGNKFQLTNEDRILQNVSLSFDASVMEVFWPLLSGAILVIPPPGWDQTAQHIVSLVQSKRLSHVFIVPSILSYVLEHSQPADLRNLKCVHSIGEPLPLKLRNDFLARFEAELYNWYGPTEASIFVTVSSCRSSESTVVLGSPLPNTRLCILDDRMQPISEGDVGGLFVGGERLAVGYLNRPDLTSNVFIPDPFTSGSQEYLYRTGDRVRLLPEGNLEFLGREDHQIKLRGHRIELGEIETVLLEHPSVVAATAMVREVGPGDQRLVAFVQPRALDTVKNIAHKLNHLNNEPTKAEYYENLSRELRQLLAEKLPAYMIPASITVLEKFPLNANQKLDRKQLPSLIGWQDKPKLEMVEPSNATEKHVASVLADFIGLDTVGRHDHFFELGGHSLLAIQALNRLSAEFEVQLELGKFMQNPTVFHLVQHIETVVSSTDTTTPLDAERLGGGRIQASMAQRPLWRINQLYGANSSMNIVSAFQLKGPLLPGLLEESFQQVLSRHETLRSRFFEVQGVLYQEILQEWLIPLERVDLTGCTQEDVDAHLEHVAAGSFSLSKGELLRTVLFECGKDEYVLMIVVHHIVSDGWSMPIFFRDLTGLYNAKRKKQKAILMELPIQYRDFAMWQRKRYEEGQQTSSIEHWKGRLNRAETIFELPTDFTRPVTYSNPGTISRSRLSRELSEKIRSVCLQHDCTIFAGLLTAFLVLLYRYTGKEDLIIGIPVASRQHQDVENLVGLFSNIVPLRADMSKSPTFEEMLQRSKIYTVEVLSHQGLPFEQLIEELDPVRHPNRPPLVQVQFVLQNLPEPRLDLTEVSATIIPVSNGCSLFDLTLELTEFEDDSLQIAWEYRTDLFKEQTIKRLAKHYSNILEVMSESPGTSIAAVPMLDTEERNTMVSVWNQSGKPYPSDTTIQTLFSQQVSKAPSDIAVIFENEEMSYGELDKRSSYLAHRLLGLGVRPGSSCGLLLNRSMNLIVAYLAILKAGAICVPLEPTHPQKRIEYILSDAGVSCVIAETALEPQLSNTNLPCLCVDKFNWALLKGNSQTPKITLTPESIACIVYTSGSSGSPKGVQLHHRGIINCLSFLQSEWPLTNADKSLLKASIGFDLSIAELLWPLLFGSILVVVNPGGHRDPAYLVQLIRDQQITHVSITPSQLRSMVEVPGFSGIKSLRAMVSCGEALSIGVVKDYYETVDIPLYNLYGPSENSIYSSIWQCPPDTKSIFIGRPITNCQMYILDANEQPVPVNVPGEIYVGGEGIAHGYINLPKQTEVAFIESPFPESPGKLYRTGDCGRFAEDGNIEYLGRFDDQVQIRGVRIEPGEIESILNQHESIQNSAVTSHEHGRNDIRLHAWVEVSNAAKRTTENDLRHYLRSQLPITMIPSVISIVDHLPRNVNGKIDRNTLKRDIVKAAEINPHAPIEGDSIAQAVAEIFSEVLGAGSVGIDDDFFENGGHSLLAFQIAIRIQGRLEATVPLSVVFNYPTPNKLAKFIQELSQK